MIEELGIIILIDGYKDEGRMLMSWKCLSIYIYSFNVLERIALCGVSLNVESVVGMLLLELILVLMLLWGWNEISIGDIVNGWLVC